MQKIQVIRQDFVSGGSAGYLARKPVDFPDVFAAARYVRVVRDAIERWGDCSLVGMYVDDKLVPVD